MNNILSIIVATDEKNGFGKGGKIPWHFPADLRHFSIITKNSICIMGRTTYEDMADMLSKRIDDNIDNPDFDILPSRRSLVLSRTDGYKAHGADVYHSLSAALESLEPTTRPIFIIGGESVYTEALPLVDVIHRTLVTGDYDCDRFFPPMDEFTTTNAVKVSADLTFSRLQRIEKL